MESFKENTEGEVRRLGVMIESVEHKVDLIAEGHMVLDAKIDNVDRKLEEFRDEVNLKFSLGGTPRSF